MTFDFDRGLTTRREVLGDKYVDRSLASATELSQPLQELVTAFCWDGVWNRPTLPRETRSLLTIAMLMAGGHHDELKTHVRGAVRNGATHQQIAETVIHGAIYCGVPAALSAMRVVTSTLKEIEEEAADG